MTAENLLNLDTDTLFEQHSVPEIDVVHKKIQTVVENKREELRTMVGERYRDLLKAADTIAAMQTSAGTLIEQVQSVHANCRSLNEQQLLGFQSTPSTSANELLQQRNANKQLNNYYSTMVQTKILTSMPELIWTHLDREQFYAATDLFIFSRHISTGLQLDSKKALMQKLPVALKQWEILRPFHVTIKQSILTVLEREQLTVDMAVDCLLSLILLEKCDMTSLVHNFLQLRAKTFLNCLREETQPAADADKRRRVKDRILASLHILNSTIDLLDKCLLTEGVLFCRLADHVMAMAPPTITRMDSSERQLAYLLPDIIANYRPICDIPHLSEEQLADIIYRWLTYIDDPATAQLHQLFGLVSSMQSIQDIKTAAKQANYNFSHMEEQLDMPKTLDFYFYYLPIINKRVHEIIRSSLAAAIQQTIDRVQQIVAEAQGPHLLEIWREQSDDLPLSLAAALSDELQAKRLANRTKGYDIAIIQLCHEFDAQLAAIIEDLNVLLNEQGARDQDKLTLINFLRQTAQQQLMLYIGQIKALRLENRQGLLYAIRCSLALFELCPHLKLCFCHPSSWQQWTGNPTTAGVEQWQRLCALLEKEMLQLWLRFIEDILTAHSCTERLPQVITHDEMLRDFALWQTQTLEQRDEQEQVIQSTIRIPSQPRLSLQTYLFGLISTLNEAVPQTLPPKVLQIFNQKMLTRLLAHYQLLAEAECTKASQNIALQLYFDLKFLCAVFAVTREDRTLYEQFQNLQSTLRDYIDPFDFELFSEHITTNASRSTARLHGELGVLTPSLAPGTQAAANVSALVQEVDPNVLCLSSTGSTSLWFPLLPIVMPQTSTGRAVSTEHNSLIVEAEKEQAATATTPTSKTTTRKTDTGKSKSGAASFFGMSQEWFR